MVYLQVLKIIRYLRRLRRRLFGAKTPHWLKDTYRLIKYVNFIELVPTVIAISTVPQHFFRRLPQILKGKNSVHKTPIAFFSKMLTLTTLGLLYIYSDIFQKFSLEKSDIVFELLLLSLLIPILVIIVILIILPILLYQAFCFSAFDSDYPQWNIYPLIVILSPKTYSRLNWTKYFWGLFYYSLYFYITFQFMLFIGSLLWVATVYLITESLVFSIRLILGITTLFALSSYQVVIRPYYELLRNSMEIPSITIHRADGYSIGVDVDRILRDLPQKEVRKRLWKRTLKRALSKIPKELLKLKKIFKKQNFDAQFIDLSLRQKLYEERRNFYNTILQIDTLENAINNSRLNSSDKKKLKKLINGMKKILRTI